MSEGVSDLPASTLQTEYDFAGHFATVDLDQKIKTQEQKVQDQLKVYYASNPEIKETLDLYAQQVGPYIKTVAEASIKSASILHVLTDPRPLVFNFFRGTDKDVDAGPIFSNSIIGVESNIDRLPNDLYLLKTNPDEAKRRIIMRIGHETSHLSDALFNSEVYKQSQAAAVSMRRGDYQTYYDDPGEKKANSFGLSLAKYLITSR